MNEMVTVEVFGIKGSPIGGGCSCSGGCGPKITIDEAYQDLVDVVQKSTIKDCVELKFIDVREDNLDDYQEVKGLLNRYGLPITAINGKPTLYGGLPAERVHREIVKVIEDSKK